MIQITTLQNISFLSNPIGFSDFKTLSARSSTFEHIQMTPQLKRFPGQELLSNRESRAAIGIGTDCTEITIFKQIWGQIHVVLNCIAIRVWEGKGGIKRRRFRRVVITTPKGSHRCRMRRNAKYSALVCGGDWKLIPAAGKILRTKTTGKREQNERLPVSKKRRIVCDSPNRLAPIFCSVGHNQVAAFDTNKKTEKTRISD